MKNTKTFKQFVENVDEASKRFANVSTEKKPDGKPELTPSEKTQITEAVYSVVISKILKRKRYTGKALENIWDVIESGLEDLFKKIETERKTYH